ncbi:MAG: DsbA family protein [Pseudomonadota bacterium]
MARIDAFLSYQSPYCYFAVPRLQALAAKAEIRLRVVRPAVLRLPDAYADRSAMEQAYFLADVARTADFLGMAYAEADPYPIAFEPGSLWRAAPLQPRIDRLIELTLAAEARALDAYAALMTLIWSGHTRNWHEGTCIEDALTAAGLDAARLEARRREDVPALRKTLRENDEALLAAGHWGVPTFALEGEPFYGQDRLDQLAWRLDNPRRSPRPHPIEEEDLTCRSR